MIWPARTAIIALVAAVLAAAASLIAVPPEAVAQSGNSPCRKDTGVSYPGGKGAPKFTGIPNAPSYEPVTVAVGSRAVVRNLIEVHNLSTSTCGWLVLSKDADWVSLSPESGALAPDKHDTIQVSINSNARSLRPGVYKARIKFQLGPASDKWHGYAVVHLEVLDKCHIKVKDANRLDIPENAPVARWRGTIGREPEQPLQHRIVVWNASRSECQLSVATNARWLDAAFTEDTVIGQGGTAPVTLSANDAWHSMFPGAYPAGIVIHDAVSGGRYSLRLILETTQAPCELTAEWNADAVRFQGVARAVALERALVQLHNRGGEPCHWNAGRSQKWLKVEPPDSTLDGGSKITADIVLTEAANELRSDEPHADEVTFSVGGIAQPIAIPVTLHLQKPECQFHLDFPKSDQTLEFHYTPGDTFRDIPEHRQEIRVSNAADSKECHYQANLPGWLESDSSGVIPDGGAAQIPVKLNADASESKIGQQTYDDAISFTVGDATVAIVPVRLKTGCPLGDACAYLHSTHTQISVGETAEMTYAVNNTSRQAVIAQLTMTLPSGWSMDGEGFANKCSGICTAIHEVPPHDQRNISMNAYPNHEGQFTLKGRAEYIRDISGRVIPYANSENEVDITVLPLDAAPTPAATGITAEPGPVPPAPAVAAPADPTPASTSQPLSSATSAQENFTLSSTSAQENLTPSSMPPPVPAPPDNTDWWLHPYTIVGGLLLLFVGLVVASAILIIMVIILRRLRHPSDANETNRTDDGQTAAAQSA